MLKEYEQSGKASVFVDKRIGEHDEALGEFDKGILRSQRELQVFVVPIKLIGFSFLFAGYFFFFGKFIDFVHMGHVHVMC